jgi:hypothetical protein
MNEQSHKHTQTHTHGAQNSEHIIPFRRTTRTLYEDPSPASAKNSYPPGMSEGATTAMVFLVLVFDMAISSSPSCCCVVIIVVVVVVLSGLCGFSVRWLLWLLRPQLFSRVTCVACCKATGTNEAFLPLHVHIALRGATRYTTRLAALHRRFSQSRMSSLYALILVDRPTTKQKAIVRIWNTEYSEYCVVALRCVDSARLPRQPAPIRRLYVRNKACRAEILKLSIQISID